MAKTDKSEMQELGLTTFSRLKELVRGLEDDEKRLVADWGPGEVEFKLNSDEVAWFVAYKTAMPAIAARKLASRARGGE